MPFQKLLIAFTLGALTLSSVSADESDLRINGDFRGSALHSATAPGWTVLPGEGATKIVRGEDFDEFSVEIAASAQGAKSVCSDFHPVAGNTLKLEVEIKGSGTASVGFLAFDAARRPLPGRVQTCQAAVYWTKIKTYFPVTDPAIRFVKIILTAEKGSTVTFGDVEAEFKRTTQQTAGTSIAVPPALPAAVPARPLIHKRFYALNRITGETLSATVPLKGEIDFELEENADRGEYWTITSYDANICRIEMEHDRDGIWPFRYDKAEIELKGIAPGTTTVVFTHSSGKSFKVLFTVR